MASEQKVKWPVQKLLVRKQQQEWRKWLRHAENLSDIEEELVCICEPELGEISVMMRKGDQLQVS
jgi:hypothetical protein